jgi:exosortase
MPSQLPSKSWDWRWTLNIAIALTMAAMVWSYWPTLEELAEEWGKNPLYSHGYVMPVFAAVLLWVRRDLVPKTPLQPSWWALVFLAAACLMRLGAAYFYFFWPERASLLVMLFAAALAMGGWAAFRWTWPSILFLVFMIPFPGFVENGLMRPLQRIATMASTNVLETLGFFAKADGNVILLSEVEMGIVEACSGLRMLSTFVALTVGACFLLDRPNWQKVVIVLSSIPIALLCNIIRISVTGVCYEVGYPELAKFVHDEVAGYLMPILALLLLLAELKILDFVFVIAPPHAKHGIPKGAALLANAPSRP